MRCFTNYDAFGRGFKMGNKAKNEDVTYDDKNNIAWWNIVYDDSITKKSIEEKEKRFIEIDNLYQEARKKYAEKKDKIFFIRIILEDDTISLQSKIETLKKFLYGVEEISTNFDYVEIAGKNYIVYGISDCNRLENWKILSARDDEEELENLTVIFEDYIEPFLINMEVN